MRTFNTLIHRIVMSENLDLLSHYMKQELYFSIEPYISQLMKAAFGMR